MPSSYVIGDHFEQFIRKQIRERALCQRGESEVVREALRALEGRERLREIEIEEYRAKIRRGLRARVGRPRVFRPS